MKLLLDLGNSALKWSLLGPQGLSEPESHVHMCDPATAQWALEEARLDYSQITQACICNVADPELEQVVIHFLESHVPVKQVKVESGAYGLTCAYDDVSRFGADRWVSMIAAHNLYPDQAKLVVDIGTAVTLDGITASGAHLGGQILPGIEMMQYSLGRGTAQVGFVSNDPSAPPWFCNSTEQGVDSGTRHAVACLIESTYAQLTSTHGSDSVLVVTGGGLEMIKPLIRVTMQSEPTLIFQGLGLIVDQQ